MAFTIAVLAKLGLIGGAPRGVAPVMAVMICPLALKFAFSFRHVRESFMNMIYSLRLFLFQMGQITHSTTAHDGGEDRWQRAARLVYERIRHIRDGESTAATEESLYALSMIAL